MDEDDTVMLAPQAEWTKVEQQWVEAKLAPVAGQVAFGDQVKACVKDGKGIVEALGLRFGSPEERDLEDDYFDDQTDYGPHKGNGMAATLNHRIPMIKTNTPPSQAAYLAELARRPFRHPVKATMTATGILVEHVLDLADEYEKTVFELAKRGKLRWSSGTAPHMVDRDDDGRIKTWHILEWAYTPYAAEPRLPTIAPVKALEQFTIDVPEVQPKGDKPKGSTVNGATHTATKTTAQSGGGKRKKMDENELKLFQEQFAKTLAEFKVTAVEEPLAAVGGEVKALDTKIETFGEKVDKLLSMFESLPTSAKAGFMTNDGGDKDPKAKSFGDFLLAVKRKDMKRLVKVYGSRLDYEAGDSESKALALDSGESGGYLVPKEYTDSLLQVSPMTSPILSRVQIIPVTRTSGEWPALDQYFTPNAGVGDTAFAGGVKATVTPEAGSLTATEPDFKHLQWRVHKIGGYTQVSNELVSDSPMAIEALLRGLFNVAVSAKQEYFILRGSGVGQPLGILNSGAKIDVTPAINGLFSWPDVATMQSRLKQVGTAPPVWLIHPSVWPDILQMEIGTAGANAWVANMQAAQGNRINGYDILQSEHLPQADNSGSVILADLFAYVLWRRDMLSIAFSEHVGFLTDQGTWRFTTRADGQPWLCNPITLADPQGSYTVSPFIVHND